MLSFHNILIHTSGNEAPDPRITKARPSNYKETKTKAPQAINRTTPSRDDRQESFFARHVTALKRLGLLTASLIGAGIGVFLSLTGVFAPFGVGILALALIGFTSALAGTNNHLSMAS